MLKDNSAVNSLNIAIKSALYGSEVIGYLRRPQVVFGTKDYGLDINR